MKARGGTVGLLYTAPALLFGLFAGALADIGFDGWAQLETESPVALDADMRRNLKFVRDQIAARNAG